MRAYTKKIIFSSFVLYFKQTTTIYIYLKKTTFVYFFRLSGQDWRARGRTRGWTPGQNQGKSLSLSLSLSLSFLENIHPQPNLKASAISFRKTPPLAICLQPLALTPKQSCKREISFHGYNKLETKDHGNWC